MEAGWGTENGEGSIELNGYRFHINQISERVDDLEQQLRELEHFCSNSSQKQPNACKSNMLFKDRKKNVPGSKKQLDGSQREGVATKRMQDLMRQFDTILRHITQSKWAGPFLEPVDVEGLGLVDYHEVIEKPMDFSTIKKKMEAKDGSGYKSVREIYSDVNLIFENAMIYNDEKNDVHVMAKTLRAKFNDRWLQLLPKVEEEERKQKAEEAEMQLGMQCSQDAVYAHMAKDLSGQLDAMDKYLEGLRKIIVERCRKMTTEDKIKLSMSIVKLPADDLVKGLEIIAEGNPTFQATADEVDIDINAQSEQTLWRLKFLVKKSLENQSKNHGANVSSGNAHNQNRKREIYNALARNVKRRVKKV